MRRKGVKKQSLECSSIDTIIMDNNYLRSTDTEARELIKSHNAISLTVLDSLPQYILSEDKIVKVLGEYLPPEIYFEIS